MAGLHSENRVVENALNAARRRVARNYWTSYGGSDGQVLVMPLPRSKYSKSDLDFIVRWAKDNGADLAKYYTPGGIASKIVAAAEKARRRIDELTKRKQADADAKFGRGWGAGRIPEQELPKTDPLVAELRNLLASVKQRPEAKREAERRDRAQERRATSRMRNADGGTDGGEGADALNAPFFRKGQRVKAKSGRWAGEVGSIVDVANRPGNFGQTRHWRPWYTVDFLHGSWQTDGSDLAAF